jgi:hypothetical protein
MGSPQLTLVTASLPDRAKMLREMLASVELQIVHPNEHLISVSYGHQVPKLNRLIGLVQTDWFIQVDDDDLLYPNHLMVLAETLMANPDADVVWTWCDVEGRDWSPNEPYQRSVLRDRNYIPSNCALRTDLVKSLGGHREGWGHHDHDLLHRVEEAGGRFVNVPTVTWRYRFHGRNSSVN